MPWDLLSRGGLNVVINLMIKLHVISIHHKDFPSSIILMIKLHVISNTSYRLRSLIVFVDEPKEHFIVF